jgi:HAD superfamily hydrolase (TIGR01509 family)
MKRVEWVLFDLGGVLVDVDQSRIFEGLAKKIGRDAVGIRDILLREVPLQSDFIVTEYLPSRLTSQVNSALGTMLAESEVVAAVNAELGETIQTTADMLPHLRSRAKVGCLSNTNSIHWDQLLSAYEFMGMFDRRFASQILGHAKPGRKIYNVVSELLGVAPHEILFFDDKPENIQTAEQLGWQARIYKDHKGLLFDLAEFGFHFL